MGARLPEAQLVKRRDRKEPPVLFVFLELRIPSRMTEEGGFGMMEQRGVLHKKEQKVLHKMGEDLRTQGEEGVQFLQWKMNKRSDHN